MKKFLIISFIISLSLSGCINDYPVTDMGVVKSIEFNDTISSDRWRRDYRYKVHFTPLRGKQEITDFPTTDYILYTNEKHNIGDTLKVK